MAADRLRSDRSRRPGRLVLAGIALLGLFTGCRPARSPNIVLILTDDQRADTLGLEHPRDAAGTVPAMPVVMDRLVADGVQFRRAYVANPSCAPSRAALLTGRLAAGNGVRRNEGAAGGAFFDDASTVATWLQSAGYRTGFFGKYMNNYVRRWRRRAEPPSPPPGWDDWRAFDHAGSVPQTAFAMAENGRVVRYGEGDYSTDVLAEQALGFIETAAREGAPFFAFVSTATPHHPWDPAARHAGAFDAAPAFAPPSLFEPDVSDKPAWVQALPPGTWLEQQSVDKTRRRQLAMQLSVDELVARLLDRLEALGIADDTVVVFTSDNGQAWGEHRWTSKACPWEECVRAPLVIRYPALAGPREEDALVSLVDLPITLAALAGAEVPGDRDGASLAGLLGGGEAPREHVLIESYAGPVRTWRAIRDERYKLVEYESGERELYDLVEDPFEQRNLAALPGSRGRVEALSLALRGGFAAGGEGP